MGQQLGTCDYCGEEHPMSLLEQVCRDYMCVVCKTLRAQHEEPELCSACNGSGEGQYDGTRCGYCNGEGEVK